MTARAEDIAAPAPVDDLFAPTVWMVVVGFNNADDTIECIASLRQSTYPQLAILYVDNGSRDEEFQRVNEAFSSLRVLRHPDNLGVARAFNSGMAYALGKGAAFVGMANNDTAFEPDAVTRLMERMTACPEAGIVIPKIFYYDDPGCVWAAGSRFRRFPPAIVQNRGKASDQGEYDGLEELTFATFCVALFRRELLEEAGLLDINFRFFYEDYDFCLRAGAVGRRVLFAPAAHLRHKISKTIKVGKGKEEAFYRTYGRSHGIFCRRHRDHPAVAGWLPLAYVNGRTLYEGGGVGLRAFRAGFREGTRETLVDIPAWDAAPEPAMIEVSVS